MIRRARPQESELLTGLTWRSKAHWGYDEAFMHAHRAGLTITAEYIAAHPAYVIEHGNRPVGFYALEPIGEGRVELGYLFVEPGYIGQGLGRRLLEHAAATAARLGHRSMRIVSDPHAVGFYRRMGARLWGEWHSPVVPGRRLPVLEFDCAAAATGSGARAADLRRRPHS